MRRCNIAKDLRTPKYRLRIVTDKKKKASRKSCRNFKYGA